MSDQGSNLQASLWSSLLPASLWLHLPPLPALKGEPRPAATTAVREEAGAVNATEGGE